MRQHTAVSVVLLYIMAVVMTMISSCAIARVRTCAVILLMDGKHIRPSNQQFEAVRGKLGPEFEGRSLMLVPDLVSAQLVATIECRPDIADPSRTDLIVRDISTNTFTPLPGKVSHPSLEKSDREHAELVRALPTRN